MVWRGSSSSAPWRLTIEGRAPFAPPPRPLPDPAPAPVVIPASAPARSDCMAKFDGNHLLSGCVIAVRPDDRTVTFIVEFTNRSGYPLADSRLEQVQLSFRDVPKSP